MVLPEKPPGWDITQETAGYHLQSDIAFSAVVPHDYAGNTFSQGAALRNTVCDTSDESAGDYTAFLPDE